MSLKINWCLTLKLDGRFYGSVERKKNLVEKANTEKIEFKITLNHEGPNMDVNPCVESRHVPHGRVPCLWGPLTYIYKSYNFIYIRRSP